MADALPLSALLSQAVIAYAREFESYDDDAPVPLPVWANLLRVIDDDGVDQRELPRLARISRRAMKVYVGRAEEAGLLTTRPVAGVRGAASVRLTDKGRNAWDTSWALVERIEKKWRRRFGTERIDRLRRSLETLVGGFDLELPHFPPTYGTADPSMTGGRAVPEAIGPPRIPAHGTDWLPVLRQGGESLSDIPLLALLSQALVGFAISYESKGGPLAFAANTLRLIGDNGLPLKDAPAESGITGAGKSGMERHGIVVVKASASKHQNKTVHLTALGKRLRDAYVPLTTAIEERWTGQYGHDVVRTLRTSLEEMTGKLEHRWPHFPNVVYRGTFREVSRPAGDS